MSQVLSVKPGEKWFKQIPKYSPNKEVSSPDAVFALKAEAENLLDSEVKVYHRLKENKKDKDFVWIKKILKAGTLSDKISAHTLLIQDSPVYNLNSLEILIGMVNPKGKRECLMAMDSLSDLFVGDLLLEDKKLKYFQEQPVSQIDTICKDSATKKRCLILWLFESILKAMYKRFLTSVDKVSHDTIEQTKMKSVSVMHRLLEENPEEEQFLLDHVINKIGDPIPKIGSHVSFLLIKLLNTHKHMKTVVIQEVERLIFRPNLAQRAKYYSLCFLNQIILSHDDFKIANQLIMIYFSQFKLFVKKGEVNNKMMSALLTGVTRAYPYAKLRDNVVMEQLDAMYKLVHLVSFNISIQALMLIFQVLDASDSVSDRFYGALYRKLLDTSLATSSKQAFFLNLVYRAMKKDVAVVRIKAFVKRLLQISLYQPPNLQCGILFLISEVNKKHPNIVEIKQSHPFDSDSDEHYEDVVEEKNKDAVKVEKDEVKHEPGSSWVHKHESKKQKTKSAYDLDCRNPLHSDAGNQAMWELLYLKQSFHPSVCLFSNQVSNSTEIKYSGDPLLDFTNARFLDRFVYRNPKKISDSLESNPTARVFGSRKFRASTPKQLHVTSNEYLQQKAGKIPEDEKFIYQYLRNRSVSAKSLKDDSDLDSVCSDEFEQLLDNIHMEDDGVDSLDFAKELGMQKANKRKAEDSDDEPADSLDDEEEEFSDLDDEEVEFDDGAFDDLDDDDLCEEDFVGGTSSTKPAKKKHKNESLSDGQLLADADEFSALLEENAGTKLDTLSGQAFKIKDKSSAKQIAWEMNRDRFIKGQKWQKRRKSFKKK